MAKEPERKDERREKARSLYDHDSSERHRGERNERRGEERHGEESREETNPDDHKEGGEPRRKRGEAKPREGMSALLGGHKAERHAMHLRHEQERMKLHGEHRGEHREIHERHEEEMRALHAA